MPTIVLNAEMSCGAAQNSTTCALMLRDRAVARPRRRADIEREGTDTITRAGAAAAPARSRASSRRSTA